MMRVIKKYKIVKLIKCKIIIKIINKNSRAKHY